MSQKPKGSSAVEPKPPTPAAAAHLKSIEKLYNCVYGHKLRLADLKEQTKQRKAQLEQAEIALHSCITKHTPPLFDPDTGEAVAEALGQTSAA